MNEIRFVLAVAQWVIGVVLRLAIGVLEIVAWSVGVGERPNRERIEEPIPVIGVSENPWRDRDPGAERADDPSGRREASSPREPRDTRDDHQAAGHGVIPEAGIPRNHPERGWGHDEPRTRGNRDHVDRSSVKDRLILARLILARYRSSA
jgi:hypothetical protein